nr:hypothetical protein [Tanacetum cinerariifolium]
MLFICAEGLVLCGSVYSPATEDINEAKKETLRPDLIGLVLYGSVYSSATEDINEAKKETLRPDLIGTLDDEYKNDDIVLDFKVRRKRKIRFNSISVEDVYSTTNHLFRVSCTYGLDHERSQAIGQSGYR